MSAQSNRGACTHRLQLVAAVRHRPAEREQVCTDCHARLARWTVVIAYTAARNTGKSRPSSGTKEAA